MRHGSLFSGIGGFDLASEWMGWENVFHCEWNEFGQKVLKYYWPKAITYNDITKTDFSIHRGTIDILTGGFPCQPYSSAGKRLGKEDSRHLWPQMLRTIREIQPTWVVGENVRGLVNWNGGMVFDEVQADLETEGYEVTPFLLPACGVGAVHRRDRIWFIAYNDSYTDLFRFDKCIKHNEINTSKTRFNAFCDIDKSLINGNVTDSDISPKESPRKSGGINSNWSDKNIQQKQWSESTEQSIGCDNVSIDASDSSGYRFQGGSDSRILRGEGKGREQRFKNLGSISGTNWKNFPSVSPICNGDDGISDRLDNITFSKWRQESIKAGGNAIVPQVVYQIFKAIDKYNQLNNQLTL
jgi:DNA (cytosine-5)-methyltransferase 1